MNANMHAHDCHTPDFYGKGRTTLEYDRLVAERVKPKLQAIDLELDETKWWDYRPLHNAEATYLFIHTYSLIFKEAWSRDVDRDQSLKDTLRGYKHDDQLLGISKQEVTYWWSARQAADAIGCKYSIFIRAAFNAINAFAAEKSYKFGRYPRPGALYCQEGMDAAVEAWESERAAYLQYPESPLYRAGSTFWAKPLFDRSIVTDVYARGSQEFVLPRLVERGILTPAEIERASAYRKGE